MLRVGRVLRVAGLCGCWGGRRWLRDGRERRRWLRLDRGRWLCLDRWCGAWWCGDRRRGTPRCHGGVRDDDQHGGRGDPPVRSGRRLDVGVQRRRRCRRSHRDDERLQHTGVVWRTLKGWKFLMVAGARAGDQQDRQHQDHRPHRTHHQSLSKSSHSTGCFTSSTSRRILPTEWLRMKISMPGTPTPSARACLPVCSSPTSPGARSIGPRRSVTGTTATHLARCGSSATRPENGAKRSGYGAAR